MIQLIKLELLKYKFKGILIGFFSIILTTTSLCLAIFLSDEEGMSMLASADEWFKLGDIMFQICFIIFAGVLIADQVVGEFRNGTISILFSYPVPRKKIMAGKLLMIFCITGICYIAAIYFYIFSVAAAGRWIAAVPTTYSISWLAEKTPFILLSGVTVAGVGLFSLFFGMLKKSTSHTIIAATIIATVLNGSIGGDNERLTDIIAIPLFVCLIGLGAALFTCSRLNRMDI